MQNEDIHARLRAAGIPREAISTTLVKEAQQEIREYITGDGYREKSIVYFASPRLELPFYVAAKEMSLSGHSVFCCSLVDIHTALFKEGDDADALNTSISGANVLAISHFYDAGGNSPSYFTPYELAYFSSWFIRQHQNEIGFLLLGNDLLPLAEEWWPSSLIRYITKRCVVFGAKGR